MAKEVYINPKISTEPDLILKEQTMLTPGIWNGIKFDKEEIIKGIQNTDWENPENSSLINYHPGKGEIPKSYSWLGHIENVRYLTLEDGVDLEGMYGDVYFYDLDIARKIASKKAHLALSIDASYTPTPYGATNLEFTHTALVYRPGCKDAYIQLEDNGEKAKARFTTDELQIQLKDEIIDETSKGNSNEIYSNQKISTQQEKINIGEKGGNIEIKMEDINLSNRIEALEARLSLLEGNKTTEKVAEETKEVQEEATEKVAEETKEVQEKTETSDDKPEETETSDDKPEETETSDDKPEETETSEKVTEDKSDVKVVEEPKINLEEKIVALEEKIVALTKIVKEKTQLSAIKNKEAATPVAVAQLEDTDSNKKVSLPKSEIARQRLNAQLKKLQ